MSLFRALLLWRKCGNPAEVRELTPGIRVFYPLLGKELMRCQESERQPGPCSPHIEKSGSKITKSETLQQKVTVESGHRRLCTHEDKVIKDFFMHWSSSMLTLLGPSMQMESLPPPSFLKKLSLLCFCDYLGSPSFLIYASFLLRSLMEVFSNALSMVFFSHLLISPSPKRHVP